MFKRKPKMRTSAEKARRSQLNVFARLAGCAYLIYIIVQMMRDDAGGMDARLRMTIAVVFAVLAAGIIVVTLIEVYKNFKAGAYKQAYYTDDFADDDAEALEKFRARQAALDEGGASGEDGDKDSDEDGGEEDLPPDDAQPSGAGEEASEDAGLSEDAGEPEDDEA